MAGEKQILPVKNITEGYSASPMQQGMRFNSLSAPDSGVDIEQILCTLPEELGFTTPTPLLVARPASEAQDQHAGHSVDLQSVSKGMATDLSQRVADLPLLTDAEQRRLLAEWNNTETDFPRDKCVQELFETQVERAPNAVALVYTKEEVSYRELDNQADRVAIHLRSLGVGPEVPVGICVQRSTDTVVGLLGLLKADGAYVPLDPAYPKERLMFMLEDSGAPVLLTQQALAGRFQFQILN